MPIQLPRGLQRIKTPDGYVHPIQIKGGVVAWGLSASKYTQEVVRSIELHLQMTGSPGLPKRAPTPFAQSYAPEMDTSKELGMKETSFYQSQIGVLRWMVELGRVDIITEVSMLASHLAAPREGHLEAVYLTNNQQD